MYVWCTVCTFSKQNINSCRLRIRSLVQFELISENCFLHILSSWELGSIDNDWSEVVSKVIVCSPRNPSLIGQGHFSFIGKSTLHWKNVYSVYEQLLMGHQGQDQGILDNRGLFGKTTWFTMEEKYSFVDSSNLCFQIANSSFHISQSKYVIALFYQ